MQFYQPSKTQRSVLVGIYTAAALSHSALSQGADPSVDAYADKILNRANTDPQAIDRNADGQVDVRDLAIYIDGQPIQASFEKVESIHSFSSSQVSLPIKFNKPLTGTLKISLELPETALGDAAGFSILSQELQLNNSLSTGVVIQFPETWDGFGGERVLMVALNRTIGQPPTGQKPFVPSTHILRIRQFEAGEFQGLMFFEAQSGIPSLPFNLGLSGNGTGSIRFKSSSLFFSETTPITWTQGAGGYPEISSIPISTSGSYLHKSPAQQIKGNLNLMRQMSDLNDAETAFLSAFETVTIPQNLPEEVRDRPLPAPPALYRASIAIHNLLGAGTEQQNPFSILYSGRMAIQKIEYVSLPQP